MKDLPIWKVSGNSPLSLHKLSDDGYKLDFSNENLLVKNKTALEPTRNIPAKMIQIEPLGGEDSKISSELRFSKEFKLSSLLHPANTTVPDQGGLATLQSLLSQRRKTILKSSVNTSVIKEVDEDAAE